MGRLVKTSEGYKLKTSAQEYDIRIVEIALIILTIIVIVLHTYDVGVIDAYAESAEVDDVEYRIKRTVDQKAGVICWTAFTGSDVSIDCMLLKDTNLVEELSNGK